MLNLELEFNNRLPLFLLYFVVSMAWKPQNKNNKSALNSKVKIGKSMNLLHGN
jgi:hypothetical protein